MDLRVRGLRHRIALRHGGPDKADQFPGDRGHGDGRSLPVADEMAIAAVQPLLRAPRVAETRAGLALAPPAQRRPEDGVVAIVPGRFDQDASRVGVAGLGQRAAALAVARGILAGDQAQVGHESPRSLEASEVADLGQQDHGRKGVDPAEASQPADRFPIRLGLSEGVDLAIQFREAGQGLLEGEERDVQRPLQGGLIEPLTAEPGPVPLRPVAPRKVAPAMAIEELHDPMPPAEDVPAHILAAAQEVPDAFLRLPGTRMAVSSPARNSRTSFRASR